MVFVIFYYAAINNSIVTVTKHQDCSKNPSDKAIGHGALCLRELYIQISLSCRILEPYRSLANVTLHRISGAEGMLAFATHETAAMSIQLLGNVCAKQIVVTQQSKHHKARILLICVM